MAEEADEDVFKAPVLGGALRDAAIRIVEEELEVWEANSALTAGELAIRIVALLDPLIDKAAAERERLVG